MTHVLLTPQTCPCDKESDTHCNVCDGGLAICSVCGKAESELDQPCTQRPHRYSYSQIQLYAECGLKYRLRYIDCLTPLGAESEHDLAYGRAIDAALNAYYGALATRPATAIIEAYEGFANTYPEHAYPASLPYWSPGKTYKNGLDALGAYAQTYKDEDRYWRVLKIQNESTGLEDEPPEISDRLVKLDLIVRDTRDELVYGVDHKSTGKYLDKDFNARFEIHSQIRQYVDHIQRTYGECGGFYINALSFRHRTKAYTPRSGPDKGVQLPAGDWYAFKRMLFTPNQSAIQVERANFDNWVAKIESDRQHGTWAYNTDQCVRGPIICPYHAICSRGYQWPRDEELILNDYRQRCIRLAKDGNRCWLEPEHEGDHDSTRPVMPEAEFELDEEIEDAVSQ